MVGKLIAITRLLRIKQWYKNVILFVGVFFGGELFKYQLYPQLLLAFILVSLVSSMNYIQNDIGDIEKDRMHPEKMKSRPLANGDLSKTTAWILFGLIAIIEIGYIIIYHNSFCLLLIAIYVNGFCYNIYLKNVPFADIISLSTIYVWRSLAGCAIINIAISPWLIIMMFLIAMVLAVCKRIADLKLLGEENASKHKSVYDSYSERLLDQILIMVGTSLFIVYTLYCVLGPSEANANPSSFIPSNPQFLVYSTPVALYLIVRYIYVTYTKPEMARKTEKAIRDKGLLIGGVLLVLIVLIALYAQKPFNLFG